jgi:hypothetical protein
MRAIMRRHSWLMVVAGLTITGYLGLGVGAAGAQGPRPRLATAQASLSRSTRLC